VGLTLGKTAVWSPFLAQLHGTAIIEYVAHEGITASPKKISNLDKSINNDTMQS